LHPQQLREKVMLYKADLGIALDGDADRLVLVDDKGDIVDGDEILAICGLHMLQKNRLRNKALVSTIMSNMGLEIALARHGGKVIRTKVGDRYVMEAMINGDYNLGGEQSGHLIFRDCATTGDGLLAALHVLEIMVESGKKISDLRDCMEKVPQVLRNIRVKDKVPLEQMKDLGDFIRKCEGRLAGKGRVLVRYSGTENLARIMVEGEDEELIDVMVDEIADQMQKSIASHQVNSPAEAGKKT
jgi:phosphoglucosamine mutase